MTYKKTLFLSLVVGLISPLTALAVSGLQSVTPFLGTSGTTLMEAVQSLVNALLTFAAIVAAIYVVIGGVRYTLSQGDEDAQIKARNTIIYAVIGIIVIILSAVLINFILAAVPII